ncbi:NO-binding membrane sensor protein with MHYT domain [Nocardiopsis arvandica]|uniref:NO-binding membrane sensor protein with MHYT domain n=1 Tax=Nocardiopsis sinuspersici TaxID=501010 RepID=A0A7Z0BIF9_9ACTN|nr:MHYT domain-containing protein [Nocardiopsis sinuspersici]NYH52036.1 NO-binding membrane sensor protein with MHYT domain [Nocardiopsis sinuspersici]
MIDHFTQGPLTPAVAYAVSVIGSFVGLVFAVRARRTAGAVRWAWLVLSAACIGGTAVWSMHFIAMMGFQVSGTALRYDIVLTVASGLLAVVVTGAALYLAITRRTRGSLLAGGAIAGSGIVAMHYMGMASINMRGHMGHDPLFVVLAVVIALVAATVALWFALRLQGSLATLAASLVMGVAVTCMHYTGMFGVHVTLEESPSPAPLPGSTTSELLLPLVIGLFVFLMVCSLLLMLDVSDPRSGGEASAGDGDESGVSPEDDESYTARHRSDDVWTRRR